MTQFEYVTTLASFIVAFGVSRLLAGWVRQYLCRKETPTYPLQLAVSALILFALLQNTWAMWLFRNATWTFGHFLLLILVQLALVGASALIHPPPDYSSSIRDYYFEVRKAVYGLCVVWITSGAILDMFFMMTVPGDLPYGLMFSIRGVAFLVFVFMAWSGRSSHHWAGLTVAGVIQFLWILGITYNPVAA